MNNELIREYIKLLAKAEQIGIYNLMRKGALAKFSVNG